MVDIRKPYKARERVQVAFNDPSLTKQQFKDECDVNLILKKYGRFGQVPAFNDLKPFYGDFVGVEDYHTALDQIMQSRAAFDRLPAIVRSRFDNDPVKMLEFVSDDKNFEEAVRLGICNPKVVDNETARQASAQVPT